MNGISVLSAMGQVGATPMDDNDKAIALEKLLDEFDELGLDGPFERFINIQAIVDMAKELQQLRAEREGLIEWIKQQVKNECLSNKEPTEELLGFIKAMGIIKSKLTDSLPLGNKSAENLQNSQNIPEREETKLTDSAQSGKGE